MYFARAQKLLNMLKMLFISSKYRIIRNNGHTHETYAHIIYSSYCNVHNFEEFKR